MKLYPENDNQKGATAIEMAIILPFLLIMVFGIIEFSLILYNKVMITNAAREGARYGVTWAPSIEGVSLRVTKADIENEVKKWLNKNLVSGDSNSAMVNIVPEIPCLNPDDPLVVTVTYQYTFFVLPDLLGNSLSDFLTLSSESTMLCEK